MVRAMESFPRPAALAAAVLAWAALPLAAQPADSDPAQQLMVRQGTPAVGGLWCGAGLLRDFTLEIVQQYQEVQGRLVRKGRVREITGRIEGATLRTDPQRNETMELLAHDNQLRITDATGVLALARGQFFTRAVGGSCSH
jgi:hypothetical protein